MAGRLARVGRVDMARPKLMKAGTGPKPAGRTTYAVSWTHEGIGSSTPICRGRTSHPRPLAAPKRPQVQDQGKHGGALPAARGICLATATGRKRSTWAELSGPSRVAAASLTA